MSLAYPGRDRPALAGISLTIRPGDRIALTGPSGAGKSSLLGLLLRFNEPTAGKITAAGSMLSAAFILAVSAWQLRHGGVRDVFTGVARVPVCLLHGATFLSLKTTGDTHQRSRRLAGRVAPFTSAATTITIAACITALFVDLYPNVMVSSTNPARPATPPVRPGS